MEGNGGKVEVTGLANTTFPQGLGSGDTLRLLYYEATNINANGV